MGLLKTLTIGMFAACVTSSVSSIAAQTPSAVLAPLSAKEKLMFHASRGGGLLSLTGSAAVALGWGWSKAA